jgi:hypothetical protein
MTHTPEKPALTNLSEAQREAYAVLSQQDPKQLVQDVYDHDDAVSAALGALIPDFEYPDFAGRTFAKVMRFIDALWLLSDPRQANLPASGASISAAWRRPYTI